jgi:glycerol uptake facilitator-like aquaporin
MSANVPRIVFHGGNTMPIAVAAASAANIQNPAATISFAASARADNRDAFALFYAQ